MEKSQITVPPQLCEHVERAVAPSESFTLIVKANAPATVGVPLITPVRVLSVRPVGNVPLAMENVYGETPPLGTAVDEYGEPTEPVLAGGHNNVSGGGCTGFEMVMLQLVVVAVA